MDYIHYSEKIFQDWLNNNISDRDSLSKLFQMDYAPEPYFEVKKGSKSIYMLLTNPGSGMDFQHRKEFSSKSNYGAFQDILSDIYLSEEFKEKGGLNAYRRLKKAIDFAYYLDYNGLINIETIPFHSERLDKAKAIQAINSISILNEYVKYLKEFLEAKPCLVVSACSSKETISIDSIKNSAWLSLQADLVSFNLDNYTMKTLTEKNGKVSSAMFVSANKYFVLMMGSNNLPTLK